jgi:hypothetical protein
MRALSLWRPWPWTFVRADKRIENRPWEIKYRGDVVFQATRRFDHSAMPTIQRACISGGFPLCPGIDSVHPAGVLVCVARVVDCVEVSEIMTRARGKLHLDRMRTTYERQAAWAFGPWCAILEDVRPLRPIPFRGSQGWFDVPDSLVAEGLADPSARSAGAASAATSDRSESR